MFFDLIQLLLAETNFPAFENSRSAGTEVSGIAKYF